jgi:glycosyltransferase involved in cell wall biosynthesis
VLHEAARLGSGVAIARVLPALQEIGWQPSVIFPEDGPLVDAFSGVKVHIASPSRPIGVSIRGWRRPPGVRRRALQSRQYFANIRQALKEQKADVVHINTLHALAEGVVARRLGKPAVLHAHEIPPPSAKRILALRAAGGVADIIIPVADTVKELYTPVVSASRLMTVYNGVELRPRAGEHSTVVVGTVGSICERKGTDILMEAASRVRSIQGDIAFEHMGPSVATNEPPFERRLAELKADSGALAFLGAGDAEHAMQRWSIFVLPSRQEAFPLATLEAMAAGMPVIATEVGGIAEQIIDGKTGILVPPSDPSALADAILALASDPRRCRQLGDGARERVAKYFTYEHQAAGLDRAYRAALARRGGILSWRSHPKGASNDA